MWLSLASVYGRTTYPIETGRVATFARVRTYILDPQTSPKHLITDK